MDPETEMVISSILIPRDHSDVFGLSYAMTVLIVAMILSMFRAVSKGTLWIGRSSMPRSSKEIPFNKKIAQ